MQVPYDCPDPVLTFEEVNFGARVLAQLKSRYEKPTGIQSQVHVRALNRVGKQGCAWSRDALEGRGAGYPPPHLQGTSPMHGHCLPDGKCQLPWHLYAPDRLGNLFQSPV